MDLGRGVWRADTAQLASYSNKDPVHGSPVRCSPEATGAVSWGAIPPAGRAPLLLGRAPPPPAKAGQHRPVLVRCFAAPSRALSSGQLTTAPTHNEAPLAAPLPQEEAVSRTGATRGSVVGKTAERGLPLQLGRTPWARPKRPALWEPFMFSSLEGCRSGRKSSSIERNNLHFWSL